VAQILLKPNQEVKMKNKKIKKVIKTSQPYGAPDQWFAIKAEIKDTWNRITDQELGSNQRNHESITGLIQNKYNHTKQELSVGLKNILKKFGSTASDVKKLSKRKQIA
jgi:hypothetical protein